MDGGEMHHGLRPIAGKNLPHPRCVADVRFDRNHEIVGRGKRKADRQIVQRHDAAWDIAEGVDNAGPYESRAAGHQYRRERKAGPVNPDVCCAFGHRYRSQKKCRSSTTLPDKIPKAISRHSADGGCIGALHHPHACDLNHRDMTKLGPRAANIATHSKGSPVLIWAGKICATAPEAAPDAGRLSSVAIA